VVRFGLARRTLYRALGVIAALTACAGVPASGEILEVGPAQSLKLPSQAAAVAKPGDIIRIAPGTYIDCAVWRASNLTIEATGDGAALADKICAGKGIFVIVGSNITVRNLTFAHAAVPDGNGAGIRAEGRNLTIDASGFIDNENGLLAASVVGSVIRVTNSLFRGNGKCQSMCAHGIYVNGIDRLEVEHSRFIAQHVGHHIKSRARSTLLIDNDIADGPDGNSSYLIDIPNGGDLVMRGNRLQKGRRSENPGTVVAIGFEGVKNQTHALIIRDNTVISDLPFPTVFVDNRTSTQAILIGNRLFGRIMPLEGFGSVSR
jgi:Right handed beta helix region